MARRQRQMCIRDRSIKFLKTRIINFIFFYTKNYHSLVLSIGFVKKILIFIAKKFDINICESYIAAY